LILAGFPRPDQPDLTKRRSERLASAADMLNLVRSYAAGLIEGQPIVTTQPAWMYRISDSLQVVKARLSRRQPRCVVLVVVGDESDWFLALSHFY